MSFNLGDYVDVNDRIKAFIQQYPDGSLQRVGEPQAMEVAGKTFVLYTAAAYRTPEDPRPGIGTAWEPFPGTTPYTKNSELMNAETAARGRAIVALGILATGASKQEVAARQAEQAAAAPKDEASDASVRTWARGAEKRIVQLKLQDDIREKLKNIGVDVPEQKPVSPVLRKLTAEQRAEIDGWLDVLAKAEPVASD